MNNNDNKLIVVGKKVKNTFNDGTKLIVRNVQSFSQKRFGKVKGSYILGALVLVLVLLLGVKIFGHKDIDYPIVYNNDGDLYLIDVGMKDASDAVKLAKNESASNVVYANTTDRYVLFQKEQKLYLYDSKDKEQTTKIMDDIIDFYFTEDDQYIVGIDKDKNLNVYNYKDTYKIEEDVAEVFGINHNKVIYNKEGKIYVRSVNPKKEDRKKITEDYDSLIQFSKDGSQVLYLNEDKDLYVYNIKKDKKDKLVGKVTSYYCDDKACNRFFYVESDEVKSVYYYDGKESKKIVSDIYMVHDISVNERQVVYSTLKDGKYNLYYQKGGNESISIEDNLTSIRSVKLYNNKEIYYLTGKNELKYVRINGNKLGKVKELADDVTGYLQACKDGYVFVGDVGKNYSGTLYLASNGSLKKIDDSVNSNILTISKDGKKIYYLKDYVTSGDLYVTNGGKGKKIDDDVYTLEYVKDNLIYYIKDYKLSNSTGDLYRYTGKSVKIAEDVTRIANPPVTYTQEK